MIYTYPQKVRKILRIALPSGANSLLDFVILTLALLFMGSFSREHIVGISIGMQYLIMFFAISAIFYSGTNAQISRYFGAKDSYSASLVFVTLFIICCACGIPIILLGYVGIGSFTKWMGLEGKSLQLCKDFLQIAIIGLPALLLKNIIISAFTAIGDTLSIFLVRIFTTIVCVIANVFFIFHFDVIVFGMHFSLGLALEIKGAALANVLTIYLELLILSVLVFKRGNFFIKAFRVVWQYFFTALRIGIPAGVERISTLGSLVLTTKFLSNFGDIALAGSQIGSRIESFAVLFGFGFMVAAMVLTGQSLGANKVYLAKDFNRIILQISSVMMGIFGVIMAVFSVPLSRFFLNDEAVIEISMMYLIAVGLSQIPLVWVFVLDGVLRGAGVTKVSLLINATSIWGLRILPIWMAILFGLGIVWIFAIICIETYIRAILFYIAYAKGVWRKPGRSIT